MSQEAVIKLFFQLLGYSKVTMRIFLLTAIFSLPLGMVLTVGRMSNVKIFSYPIRLYLLIMRGTPLLLQLVAVYFIPPKVFGYYIDRSIAAILAMTLNYAAYFAEIYRSGFESMPKGQYEAAEVLGFSKRQRFLKIILPQVIKKIVPPMGSEFMTLVKDTALVSCIGIEELYVRAQSAMNTESSVIPIVIAACFYLVMNGVVAQAFRLIEKRLSYYN